MGKFGRKDLSKIQIQEKSKRRHKHNWLLQRKGTKPYQHEECEPWYIPPKVQSISDILKGLLGGGK